MSRKIRRGGGPGGLPFVLRAAGALVSAMLVAHARAALAAAPAPAPGGAHAVVVPGARHAAAPAGGATATRPAPPLKLVLVTIDGLPGGSESARLPMPELYDMGHQGTRFALAMAPSPLAFPALAAVLTGSGPERTGVTGEALRGVPARAPRLAVALAHRGYRGAAFPADLLEHAECGLATGFAHWSTRSPALAESARVDSALAWVRAPGRRFAWLGLSLGAPPEPWRRMDGIGPAEPGEFAVRQNAIDRMLGRLRRGLVPGAGAAAARNDAVTLVVVGTGWSPASTASLRHSGRLLPGYRVPLVVSGPWPDAPLPGTPYELTRIAAACMRLTGGVPGVFEPARAIAVEPARDGFAAPLAIAFGPGLPDSALVARWRELLADLGALAGRPDTLALARLGELAARVPDSPRIALEYAVARSRAGAEKLPSADLKRTIDATPSYEEMRIAYADHLLRYRRAAVVPAVLAPIAPASPLAAPAAWRQVLALAAQGEFGAAAVAAGRASRLAIPIAAAVAAPDTLRRLGALAAVVHGDPRDVAARFAFAGSLAGFELDDAAFEQLHAARALSPTSGEADYRIAQILLRQGRNANAIGALERAVRSQPSHRPARLLLADLLMESGQRAEARRQLEQALADDPREPRGQFNLACLRALDGERGPALDALERAVDQGYDDWDRITGDADLASLRDDARYRSLVARRR